jgi:hypothetical protein
MGGLGMNMFEQAEIPWLKAGAQGGGSKRGLKAGRILCIGATASKEIGGRCVRAKLFRSGTWNVRRTFRTAARRRLRARLPRPDGAAPFFRSFMGEAANGWVGSFCDRRLPARLRVKRTFRQWPGLAEGEWRLIGRRGTEAAVRSARIVGRLRSLSGPLAYITPASSIHMSTKSTLLNNQRAVGPCLHPSHHGTVGRTEDRSMESVLIIKIRERVARDPEHCSPEIIP